MTRAYPAGHLTPEVTPYEAAAGTLRGLPTSPSSPALAANEAYADELVYEVHPSSDLTGEQETFHFVLATGRYKDNRIPPKGFDIAGAAGRISQPVWHGQDAPEYFTAAEYAGGYDEVALAIAPGADYVQVVVYYQTTSREYIEFLRNEINGTASTLPAGAYIAQTDPFFAKLKAWGDQSGKSQLVAVVGLTTSYTDTGLTNGQSYCYKVASLYADCESAFSQVKCAVPNNQGQARSAVGKLETGRFEKTGKGKRQTVTFVLTTRFAAGDEVVVRAYAVDVSTGLPLADATVTLVVAGPEAVTLTSAPSDANGVAEAKWKTSAPKKRGAGGTAPGEYTVTVTNVAAGGYTWDAEGFSATFTLE